jgi:hypothetical protein
MAALENSSLWKVAFTEPLEDAAVRRRRLPSAGPSALHSKQTGGGGEECVTRLQMALNDLKSKKEDLARLVKHLEKEAAVNEAVLKADVEGEGVRLEARRAELEREAAEIFKRQDLESKYSNILQNMVSRMTSNKYAIILYF